MRALLLPLFLTGCAVSPSAFNADKASDKLIATMANDAASQIKSIYPSSKMKLVVMDSNKYGSALTAALRKSGFAIADKEGNSVNYLVDKLDEAIYRTSLTIGKTTLSRPYIDGAKPVSIADWTIGVANGR